MKAKFERFQKKNIISMTIVAAVDISIYLKKGFVFFHLIFMESKPFDSAA